VNSAITDQGRGIHEYDAKFEFGRQKKSKNEFNFEIGEQRASGGSGFDTLEGRAGPYQYSLRLKPLKGPVLHHGNGFHRYPFGGYTWYYSRPRLAAEGKLTVDGQSVDVRGTAWFDHQWGDLEKATEIGWDWFALQLEDGSDLMLFMSGDHRAGLIGGTWSDKDGSVHEIKPEHVNVRATGTWKSPLSGALYPMGWEIDVEDTSLRLTPVMKNQELFSKRHPEKSYWEGAVIVHGDIKGRGYVELAGYCRSGKGNVCQACRASWRCKSSTGRDDRNR
jgi:predicted secreted hydrolase